MPRGRPKGQHGGYRAPATPAAVSGPGALAQRTDGGPGAQQPIRPIPSSGPGGQFGGRQASVQQQQGAPLAAAPPPAAMPVPPAAGGAGAPASPFPSQPVDVFAPTGRPSEPITAGVNAGPGAGAPDQAGQIGDWLRGVYQQFPFDGVRDLLEELDTNAGNL